MIDQLDMEYPPARGDAPEESHLAAKDVSPYAASQRREILEYIKTQSLYGATCDEIEDSLGIRHQTASARMKNLKDSGDIVRHPDRLQRPTRSGSKAGVWVAK